jgi:dihydroorotase
MNLLIINGRVVDPSQKLDAKLDVLIEDGRIARVDKKIKSGVDVFDAAGLVVTPGFVDLHTHLREPGQEHKETIATATRAAVAGGYSAVCAMANTVPPNDERAVTEMVVAEAARHGACRVYPIGAVSRGLKGEELAELADLRTAGCVAVSDDGKPVWNAQLMRRALEYCSMLDIPVIAHEEDANLNEGGVMHEGYYSTLLGLAGIPAASEETLVARDVILARLTGAHLHIAHMSTAGAIEVVRRARRATNLKMNPPLRSKEHRQAILEGIADGTVDAIATDHAPHHFDEKNVEFDLAPFGVIGLETAFPVCYDRLVRKKVIALDRLIDLFSCGPARVFNLPGGSLRQGSVGDVTILDLEAQYEAAAPFVSKASNSAFIGEKLQGRAVATIVGGEVRYDRRVHAAAAPAKSAAKKKSKR